MKEGREGAAAAAAVFSSSSARHYGETPIKKLVRKVLEEFKPKRKRKRKKKKHEFAGNPVSVQQEHLEANESSEFGSFQDVLESVKDDRALRDLLEDKINAEDFVSRILPSKTEEEVLRYSSKMGRCLNGLNRVAQVQFAKEESSLFDYLREEKEAHLREVLHEVNQLLRELLTVTEALDNASSSALQAPDSTSGGFDTFSNQQEERGGGGVLPHHHSIDNHKVEDDKDHNIACALLHIKWDDVPESDSGATMMMSTRGGASAGSFLFQQFVYALLRDEYSLASRCMSLADKTLIKDKDKDKVTSCDSDRDSGGFFHRGDYVAFALSKLKRDTNRVLVRMGENKSLILTGNNSTAAGAVSIAIRTVFRMIDRCLELLDLQQRACGKDHSEVVCFVAEIVECLVKQLVPVLGGGGGGGEIKVDEEGKNGNISILREDAKHLCYLHLYEGCYTISQRHPGLNLWPFVEATLALFQEDGPSLWQL
jgi:hypothetical protein